MRIEYLSEPWEQERSLFSKDSNIECDSCGEIIKSGSPMWQSRYCRERFVCSRCAAIDFEDEMLFAE